MSPRTGLVLSVRDLACGYGGVPLLEGLSFDVYPGEALALTGANGSGKSTVLRTALAQQPALGGERTLKDGPLVEASAVYRRTVSCLLDEDAFLPGVSVRHHLELIARGHGISAPEALVAGVLAEFGLTGRAGASPYDLSSGQRRPTLLAAALLRPFELLVLDEPEQRLDAAMREQLSHRLVAAREAGAALLFATHDPALAAAVGTAVLPLGRDDAPPGDRP